MQDLIKLFERYVAAQEKLADAAMLSANKTGLAAADTASPSRKPAATKKDAPPADNKPTDTTPHAKDEVAAPAKTDTPPPADTTAAPESDFPYEKLKKAIVDLANAGDKGKKSAVALLAQFGVKKASDAPSGKWEEMYDAAVTELGKLDAQGE